MVCLRCKLIVKSVLDKLSISYVSVELGEVNILNEITYIKLQEFNESLKGFGFCILEGSDYILVEKIKNLIIEMVHYQDELPKIKYSLYIQQKLKVRYALVSKIFCHTKGISIEHYIMLHKIEKVKELLVYDELNINEIAIKLHYCSTAHLSSQFKKYTGLTPTSFKAMKRHERIALEDV